MRAETNIPEKSTRSALIRLVTVILLPVISLIALDLLIIHPLVWNNHLSTKLAIILIIIPKIIALPWIGISTLRFTEYHFKKFGVAMVKTSLLACLCLAVLVISVSAIDAIQEIIFMQNSKASGDHSRAPVYRLSADMVKKEYTIEGIIDFGISRDFRLLLKQHPGGTRVVLSSQGGSIYEGRGLAIIIHNHKLDTHAIDECSSACTLAFIGGQGRSLGASAKLGFHQYSMEYLNRHQAVPFHDPVKEQKRDTAFMRERGISKEFVDRVFDKQHQDIWYPDHASLLRYNVVHSIH